MKKTVLSKYGAATQIVVSEYDEFLKKLRVVKRYEIPPSDFTFDHAVQKIIKLNNIWNPKFIYMDAGSGEYQIEYLRKYGEKNPETGLSRKIVRIQFSENLEVVDPVTGEVDKKQAKDFMINQTALLLEREQLSLSGFDDEFITQMTNYRVIGKTSSGRNIYSEEDHIIDSYMLSILGFILNYPDLMKTLYMRDLSRSIKTVSKNPNDTIKEKIFQDTASKSKLERESSDNPNWSLKRVSLGRKRGSSRSFSRGSIGRGSFRRTIF